MLKQLDSKKRAGWRSKNESFVVKEDKVSSLLFKVSLIHDLCIGEPRMTNFSVSVVWRPKRRGENLIDRLCEIVTIKT